MKTHSEDELIEATDCEEWQQKLKTKFSFIEEKYNLPVNTLSVRENGVKEQKNVSKAICVYEPDLVEERRESSRYTVLARVRENVLKTNESIVDVYSKSFSSQNEKKRFEKDSEEFIESIIECIEKGIQNYVPKAATFACCSRYQACSDAGKCVHPNVLFAKACRYRENLENGEVFY